MSINLGSNPFGLYLGSSKIGEAYVGSTKIYSSGPVVLPDKTLRFKFSNTSYTPTTGELATDNGVTSRYGTWTAVSSSNGIWDWYYNSTDWSTSSNGLNAKIFNLADTNIAGNCSVLGGNLNGVTTIQYLFSISSGITSVKNLVNTTRITSVSQTFSSCPNLENIEIFDTSNVTTMFRFFYQSGIKHIPLFNTSKVTNMNYAFCLCRNAESGALALYQQASTQQHPPSSHDNTFTNCGINTTTGAAELAQIPSSWGGTGA